MVSVSPRPLDPPSQVSMLEVYNESVYDLLAPPEDGREKLTIQKRGKDLHIPVS